MNKNYIYNFGFLFRKALTIFLVVAFTLTAFNFPTISFSQVVSIMPVPGTMVGLSKPFTPAVLKGIKVFPNDPLKFDFIFDKGDAFIKNDPERSEGSQLNSEANKLIKYFLASLTTPEKDLWVNLSPYEKNRIVPKSFGNTEMGRDLLAQDYILKQITATLMYPDGEQGKKFWDKIYAEVYKQFGNIDIPVDTFNKVWIVPAKAVVYENLKAGAAYIVETKLKVLLETDYIALKNSAGKIKLAEQAIREVIIPVIEKEVNEGENFAPLRQIYNSLILASWYKKKIKESLVNAVYSDRNKIKGININDPLEAEKIWDKYVESFKKGAYDFIKEEYDPTAQKVIPKKYFSGGVGFVDKIDQAMLFTNNDPGVSDNKKFMLIEGGLRESLSPDPAMIVDKPLVIDLDSPQGTGLNFIISNALIDKRKVILKNGEVVYKDLEVLGSYDNGVYKATKIIENSQYGQTVVLKFLKRSNHFDFDEIAKFFNDSIFDETVESLFANMNMFATHLFYTNRILEMEYAPGRKFDEITDFRARIKILVKLIKKLAYVHRTYKAFHGDISFNNLIVTPEGDPKIIDWDLLHMAQTTLPVEQVKYGLKYKDIDMIGCFLLKSYAPNATLVSVNTKLTGEGIFGDIDMKDHPITEITGIEEVPVGIRNSVLKALLAIPGEYYESLDQLWADLEPELRAQGIDVDVDKAMINGPAISIVDDEFYDSMVLDAFASRAIQIPRNGLKEILDRDGLIVPLDLLKQTGAPLVIWLVNNKNRFEIKYRPGGGGIIVTAIDGRSKSLELLMPEEGKASEIYIGRDPGHQNSIKVFEFNPYISSEHIELVLKSSGGQGELIIKNISKRGQSFITSESVELMRETYAALAENSTGDGESHSTLFVKNIGTLKVVKKMGIHPVWEFIDEQTQKKYYLKIANSGASTAEWMHYLLAERMGCNVPRFRKILAGQYENINMIKEQYLIDLKDSWGILTDNIDDIEFNDLKQKNGSGLEEFLLFMQFTLYADFKAGDRNLFVRTINGQSRYLMHDLFGNVALWLMRKDAAFDERSATLYPSFFYSWWSHYLDELSPERMTQAINELLYISAFDIRQMALDSGYTEDQIDVEKFQKRRSLVIHNLLEYFKSQKNDPKALAIAEAIKGFDFAMVNNGGIDLTPVNENLKVDAAVGSIKFNIDPVMLEKLKNSSGFEPVIFNILPMKDLRGFLGL
ncbi:MAG: hypothetical protein HQL25_01160 [Candidatus Omnitrophica bacterium]|nr:hypothetical protein [Candidatus Omnitrophota bacterium]